MEPVDITKPIAEKMFPHTLEAIYWAMKKYKDEKIYRLELTPIIGEGTKAIIYMRDIKIEEEAPVIVTPKKAKAVKKVKAKKNARSAKKP